MPITEQDIRRLAIGRLRLFYKFRPRRDWDGIRIVDRPHYYQHITIDARLTYIEPDGKPFVATVEATSLDRRAEVDYQFSWFRWIVESTCLATLISGIILGLTQVQFQIRAAASIDPDYRAFNVLYNDIIDGRWWLIYLAFLSVWAICAFVMTAFPRRYRYIYAVEQFKQFHADDQWVAISHDVFPSHLDRRFRELKRQCVRYGFGLMEVEADRSVRILVAPKQGDYFAGKPRIKDWIPLPAAPPVLKKMLPPGTTRPALPAQEMIDPLLRDPLDFTPEQIAAAEAEADDLEPETAPTVIAPPLPSSGRPTIKAEAVPYLRRRWNHFRWLLRSTFRPKALRDRPGYLYVGHRWLLIGGIGLALSVFALYRDASDTPYVTAEEKAAAWPLERLERDYRDRVLNDPDSEARLNDFYPDENALDHTEVPYALEDELSTPFDADGIDPADAAISAEGTDVFFYRLAEDTTILFSCLPLPGGDEPVYALEYTRTADFETALDRAFALHRSGGPVVTITRGDCLALGNPGYLVYLGDLITEESQVNFLFRQYTRDLGLELEVYTVR